jgi:hypothetical protein
VGFYQQKKGTPEILTIDPLLNVLKLTPEWVCAGAVKPKRPSLQPPSHPEPIGRNCN